MVCTLCSCYPWTMLGLPPTWYKSAAYRSRAVIDPRGVLREFGTDLADDVEVRVWDSTAELRYLVIPERPAGTEHMSEQQLAGLVTRDAMVGVAWQGMLRKMVPGGDVQRVAPSERGILKRADLVGLSHLDVARDTSLGDLARFLRPGARLLVTQGGHGGLLVTTDAGGPMEVLRYLPTPTEHEVDPTGAGDTFLAALLAVLVRPSVAASPGRALARALRFAAAACSLAVEDVGLAGVPDRRSVLVRRARERVRRAVIPSLTAQVGVEDPRQ